jgi:hypothetical protein
MEGTSHIVISSNGAHLNNLLVGARRRPALHQSVTFSLPRHFHSAVAFAHPIHPVRAPAPARRNEKNSIALPYCPPFRSTHTHTNTPFAGVGATSSATKLPRTSAGGRTARGHTCSSASAPTTRSAASYQDTHRPYSDQHTIRPAF